MKNFIFALIFVLILLYLLFTTSFDNKNEITLPGKIAIESWEKDCYIYENSISNKHNFKLRDDEDYNYSGLMWLNENDNLICAESVKDSFGKIIKNNIVELDLAGSICDRIYESQIGELVGYAFPSRNDEKLMFTTSIMRDIKKYPLDGLSHPVSLVIMDFKRKKVIKRIENIGIEPNFDLNESPWLDNGNRFIYSIIGDRTIVLEGKTINPDKAGEPGIYIYDLGTNVKKLLVPDGHDGISSSVNLQIAYIKDKSLWVLDLKDYSTKLVYKAGFNEKVTNIHWTPDGNYIYLVRYNYYFTSDFWSSGEKLIEVSTGNEIPFKKLSMGLGLNSYTWK